MSNSWFGYGENHYNHDPAVMDPDALSPMLKKSLSGSSQEEWEGSPVQEKLQEKPTLNSQESILAQLEQNYIIGFSEDEGMILVEECCDNHFHCYLTKEQVAQLAKELLELIK